MDSENRLLEELRRRLGTEGVVTDPGRLAPHLQDERGRLRGNRLLWARPNGLIQHYIYDIDNASPLAWKSCASSAKWNAQTIWA